MAKNKTEAPVTLEGLQKLIKQQQEQLGIYEARILYLTEKLQLKDLS